MLPDWEPGTPAVLIAAGPHAIPVSTAVRRDDRRVVFALGRGRAMLERLRAEPDAALCVLARGVAFTAYGRARIVREELDAAPVVAVELAVERVQDHLADGRTAMLDGARYAWRDTQAAEAEPRIRAELGTL
jgi:hypothetical protein